MLKWEGGRFAGLQKKRVKKDGSYGINVGGYSSKKGGSGGIDIAGSASRKRGSRISDDGEERLKKSKVEVDEKNIGGGDGSLKVCSLF